MHTKVVTTITSEVNLDTMEPTHSVSVSVEDDLPAELAYAAALGGCKATINTIEKQYPRLRVESAPESSPEGEDSD